MFFCLTLKSPNLTSLYFMQLILRASKGMGNIRLWNEYSPPRFVKRKIWRIVWNLLIQFHLNPWESVDKFTGQVMPNWFKKKTVLSDQPFAMWHNRCVDTVVRDSPLDSLSFRNLMQNPHAFCYIKISLLNLHIHSPRSLDQKYMQAPLKTISMWSGGV